MQSNQKKQKNKSKKATKQKDTSLNSRSGSANLKSDQAACEYEQTTTKKVKNEKNISPIQFEEITLNPHIPSNSQFQDKLICEELVRDLSPFSFNDSLEHQIQQEEEQETLSDFMREQVKFEEIYSYSKNYLNNQIEIQSHMVTILFDWLIEVSHSFHFKRETFYLSINYVERYLIKQHDVQIAKFQLLGVAAIFIAHKCEEIYPKTLRDFHRLIQDQHTIHDIEEMEVQILKSLDFRMNPNTPIFWLNYYTKLWDDFIQEKNINIYLKERSNDSYYRYRELVQLFDACLIDYKYKGNQKLTALTIIYLVVAKALQIFEDYQQIATSYSEISDFFHSENNFNTLFKEFLVDSELYLQFERKIEFEDLNEVLQDVIKYFILTFDNTLPRVLQNNQDFIDEMQHEELLSFQTYNKHTIETINKIQKQTP